MLKLKLQYFVYLMQRPDSLERTLMLGKIEGRRRRGDSGWDGWMASLTQWTWVWASSGSWWWTGKPGVLQSTGSQRVRHDWTTEQQLSNSQRQCRMVVAKGWGEMKWRSALWMKDFRWKEFWSWLEVMVAQPRECTNTAESCSWNWFRQSIVRYVYFGTIRNNFLNDQTKNITIRHKSNKSKTRLPWGSDGRAELYVGSKKRIQMSLHTKPK